MLSVRLTLFALPVDCLTFPLHTSPIRDLSQSSRVYTEVRRAGRAFSHLGFFTGVDCCLTFSCKLFMLLAVVPFDCWSRYLRCQLLLVMLETFCSFRRDVLLSIYSLPTLDLL